MKRKLLTPLILLLCLAALLTAAYAFDTSDLTVPDSATAVVYGTSGAGRSLTAYRFGTGENVLVAGFAIHGWEDNFDRDGGALVYTANELMKKLDANASLLRDYNWTVYVLPCMNPDGLMDGTTCNGPGRCTTTYLTPGGSLITGTGVDLNRSFPTAWTQYTSIRNFNGAAPLAAREAKALAQFVQQVKGPGANICLDVHGWYQQIITSNGKDSQLFRIFADQFPYNSYANCTNGRGYFTAYTASLGYASCLFEFPGDVYSMNGFLQSGYCERFNTAVLRLLPAYGSYDSHLASCPSRAFGDVGRHAWYHEAVDYVVENGIFNGMSTSSFAPDLAMTRAMLVTTLWRLAGSPETDVGVVPPAEGDGADTEPEEPVITPTFSDVAEGQWYSKAVLWAAANGVVDGYPDGTFRPDQNITREQLVTVLHRYAGKPDTGAASFAGFPDASSVSNYAQEALQWAYGNQLVQGVTSSLYTGARIQPQGTATRAQVAAILMRYLQNIEGKKAAFTVTPAPAFADVEPNVYDGGPDLGGN